MPRRENSKTRKKSTPSLPKLKPSNPDGKKHHYKLTYTAKKRRLAIDEGIRGETKRIGKRKAATAKKGRLNILRIYRRFKNYDDCKTITRDMKYIDKKYKLGNTKDICERK